MKRTRCPHCRRKLEPSQRIHAECIDGYAEASAAKAEREAAKRKRLEERVRRAKIRQLDADKIPPLIKKVQKSFNAFIRERDKDEPCISCGNPLGMVSPRGSTGGAFDCGHYRSVGSASHLRFNEDNAHGQCKHCNQWLAGSAVEYRQGLIQRIGQERVEFLENDNRVHKWTADELRAIDATYRQKLKDLKKERE